MPGSNALRASKTKFLLPGACPLHSFEAGTHYCGLDLEETTYIEVSPQKNPAAFYEFLEQLWSQSPLATPFRTCEGTCGVICKSNWLISHRGV